MMIITIFYLELGAYTQLSKYVEIFTHHVGSMGTLSRRTVFVRGTSAEQREFSKIAGRNTKANIF
jgi:hypothetical protein